MKVSLPLLAIFALFMASCSSNQNSSKENTSATENEATSSTKSDNTAVVQEASGPGAVVSNYLDLKNELATDNSDGAASVGGKLLKAIKNLGSETMTAEQKKAYADLSGDIEENSDHISKNGGNIKHQREHFENLSQDMLAFVKTFGTPQTLYKDYCPMKKAYWLTESKDIKNPYFGKEMLECGEIQDTLNVAAK